MIPLPAVNESVGVYVIEWETALRSRVEDVAEGSLTIAMPSDGRSERPLPRGAAVYVDWICARGVVRARGVVSELVRIPIPALVVIVDGEPEVHQRRNHVRAAAHLAVVATPVRPDRSGEAASPAVTGTTFDVSGGGMRVRLPGLEAEVGERIAFDIAMPDESLLQAVGRIMRCLLPDVYCVEFDEIDERTQERLVRLVFQRLRSRAGRAA